ncbi:MAG: RNA-binding domain-containing protein [Erysipelotrichaceae bacterium]
MKKHENYNLEFKEQISKTFLKTICAYSNYNDGVILFGVNDEGEYVGLSNIDEDYLKIENMINDSISPRPSFKMSIEEFQDKKIIKLLVSKGKHPPYYYQNKTYKRSGSSTLEVDRIELKRLILEGFNLGYEEIESSKKNLDFSVLESKLVEKLNITKLGPDILKTLNLMDSKGNYNFAAELLANQNEILFSGIDIARFGSSINQILHRETIKEVSLLTQYDKAVESFKRYYQLEEIIGLNRVKKELIPEKAFREAIANAIVHRVWDVNAYIQVSMFEDKIIISSPGGLPIGLTEDDYLYRNISLLRNPIISEVFYKLNYIEKFGTGVMRINEEYSDSIVKPSYKITENFITVTLPTVEIKPESLSSDEKIVFDLFVKDPCLSRLEIENKSGFNKSKAIRTLNSLIDKSVIEKIGNGPSTEYRIKGE